MFKGGTAYAQTSARAYDVDIVVKKQHSCILRRRMANHFGVKSWETEVQDEKSLTVSGKRRPVERLHRFRSIESEVNR